MIAIVTTDSVSCCTFLVVVFVSYSRNKLILLRYDVMCAIQQLLTKAQNTVSTYIKGNFKFPWYITTENVVVRYDSYLPKAL